MFRYEYVTVACRDKFFNITLQEHRLIIDNYAQRGYRFVGFVPVKMAAYGQIVEIDLIFETQ